MRSLTLPGLFVLGLLATSCTSPREADPRESTSSIVGDEAHGDDIHAAVVAITGGDHLCSGTVIGRDGEGSSVYVLTAAHCCRRSAPPDRIRVGGDARAPARSLPIDDFQQHPCYNPINHDYDFCVIRVADEGSLNVAPIPPASAPDGLGRGSEVTFVGYGSTPATNASRRRVSATLSEVGGLTIAADQRDGRGGICFGDSGGPALIRQGGREVVAGVSSFGTPSSLCNATGVAGRVSDRAVRAEFIDEILAGRTPRITDSLILRFGTSPGQVRDTYVASDAPDRNFGDSVELLVGEENGATRRALLRFDLSGIPAGAEVLTAHMGFHEESKTGKQIISAHRITQEWDEDTTTWASFGPRGFELRPLASISNATPVVAMTSDVWFDVTSLTREWLSMTTPNHGVLLLGHGTAQTQLLASELGRLVERPWLHVCYLPAER
jgi:secreted trypsin-like serine protease